MAFLSESYQRIHQQLNKKSVTLIAVSKTKPNADILEAYELGHRDFGENYVQELLNKESDLPKDIHWHFIGHLQRNKVKYIAPFVYLIHGVDSISLLQEINKQGKKINRVIPCLLQVFIATEESKFGLDENELKEIAAEYRNNATAFSHISIRGLMGMASFSDDAVLIRNEFKTLKQMFNQCKSDHLFGPDFNTLSMGMSADYNIAVEEGSNMVRIGSLLFGERQNKP